MTQPRKSFFIGLRNHPADALRTNGNRCSRNSTEGVEHGVDFRTSYGGTMDHVCLACLVQDEPALTFVNTLNGCPTHPFTPHSKYDLDSDVVGVDEADLFDELRDRFDANMYFRWAADAPKRKAEEEVREAEAIKEKAANAARHALAIPHYDPGAASMAAYETKHGPYTFQSPHTQSHFDPYELADGIPIAHRS